jgi:hypothetical protein
MEEGVWTSGGMILTGQIRTTGRGTCPFASLSTGIPTPDSLKSNPDLRGEKPVIDRLSHGTVRSYCVKVVQIYMPKMVLYIAVFDCDNQ